MTVIDIYWRTVAFRAANRKKTNLKISFHEIRQEGYMLCLSM